MLQHWGFLAHSDLPDRDGPSYLLVVDPAAAHARALRPRGGRVLGQRRGGGRQPASADRVRPGCPLDARTTWGLIRVTDRLRVTNEWLSFGGSLQAEPVDGAIVAVFTSTAPLLRRGGHSQGWDEGAPSVGAFFAKVRAVAGYRPPVRGARGGRGPARPLRLLRRGAGAPLPSQRGAARRWTPDAVARPPARGAPAQGGATPAYVGERPATARRPRRRLHAPAPGVDVDRRSERVRPASG